ncbi:MULTISPECIES: helix-turn-helix domain-containing protein [Anaerotruncus]|jgi:putative transcriptional regulator|uniref:helix-turn-helix domain-containing protein n=1 Tax=Anaerotruncus TaxID=244127 RepID=UPI00083413FF|nr:MULTISPECIES: helix-turn-helix domain-containing protein [Anaerotruncus]RGX54486.1 XRE family transcriptional regulator [Anaerotruncus sp. AF02-27]
MIRLNALEILQKKGKTKYWLAKHLGTSGQNLNKILYNETRSIRYSTIEALCQILECTPNDLFVIEPDQQEHA